MTLQSPVKLIYITQKFGVNPSAYALFGLKGHNGLDLRAFLPNGERCYEGGKSEVFSPQDGACKENALDVNGYGWYVKIESATQGSVLGHFHTQSPIKIGTQVKMGQLVGYQGSTGNSTGIHLHWGWYPIPRNRSNGFLGFENQEGKYQPYSQGVSMDYEKLYNEARIARDSHWSNMSKLIKATGLTFTEATANAKTDEAVSRIVDTIAKLKTADTRVTELTQQLNVSNNTTLDLKTRLAATEAKLTECLNRPITTPTQPTSGGRLNGYTKQYEKDGVTIVENYAIDQ